MTCKFIYVYTCGNIQDELSCVMRKPAFCIWGNKNVDQLRSNCAADRSLFSQPSAVPLLSKSEIPSLQPSSVVVQPSLCGTW